MSNILKGIINEVNSHDYDSDWDYQDAVARSGKSRSSYRSQEDDTSDADIAYSKKMYQLGQQQKAEKEKAQRDSDHDRLASGTNEDINETSNPYEPVMIQGYDKWLKLVNIPNVDKHAYKSDITAVTSLGDIIGEFNTDKDLGYVIKKYVKKGMSEAGTGLDIDRSIPGRTIARISGDIKHRTGSPSGKKLPDYHPDDDYDQWSGKVGPSIHDDEEDTFDTDYTGDEDGTLKEISNEKLAQYKTAAALDAGKSDLEGNYKRADKRFSGIVKATKKQFANDTKKSGISQGISEESNKFNSKQEVINHFVKNGKSAAAGAAAWERGYRGSNPKKPIELKKPPQKSYHDDLDDKRYSTFENLGDQLKSKSLEALTLLKQQIEQKRAEDLAQWEQDFKNNVANKMRNQPIRSPEATPVAQPGEKHSILKARLAQLNSAIEKQALLDKLVDKLERKGLMTPAMQNDTDTRMHVRYGAKDNYQSLNQKLDNAIATLQNRLDIRKKSGLKETPISEDDTVTGRMRMNDYYELADAIQEKLRHAIQMGDKARIQELNKQRDELDARVKKHGMMPENVDETDMNRRGFLGNMGKAAGAGALAAAGLGGASNAQAFKGTLPARAPSISEDEAEAQIKQLRSKAYEDLGRMVWMAWPKILDTTFGANNTPADKPATPDEIGRMLSYRIAEYAEEYRQKVRAIKTAAGVRDPQSLNKTNAAIYINEQDIDEAKQRLDPKCWKGYKKQGTKMKGDTRVNNCVPVKETKSHILAGLQQIDEGWKDKLGAAALAGSMALGAAGANADTRRVTPDGQGGFTGGMKPTATVQAEPAPATPSTTTIPGQGLVRAERADRQAGTVTVNGQEYKMIMLEPGGIRPRGGQQIAIPLPVMGERGLGNYIGILAGGRVFVLPNND